MFSAGDKVMVHGKAAKVTSIHGNGKTLKVNIIGHNAVRWVKACDAKAAA